MGHVYLQVDVARQYVTGEFLTPWVALLHFLAAVGVSQSTVARQVARTLDKVAAPPRY